MEEGLQKEDSGISFNSRMQQTKNRLLLLDLGVVSIIYLSVSELGKPKIVYFCTTKTPVNGKSV